MKVRVLEECTTSLGRYKIGLVSVPVEEALAIIKLGKGEAVEDDGDAPVVEGEDRLLSPSFTR